MTDEDIRQTLILFDPASFDAAYREGTTQKGLLEIPLAEGAKLQVGWVWEGPEEMMLSVDSIKIEVLGAPT